MNPEPAKAVTYRVTNQIRSLGPNGAGGQSWGYRVLFALSNGHAGEVFVTDQNFTPENVAQAVRDMAHVMGQISGITGTV